MVGSEVFGDHSGIGQFIEVVLFDTHCECLEVTAQVLGGDAHDHAGIETSAEESPYRHVADQMRVHSLNQLLPHAVEIVRIRQVELVIE